MMAGVFFTGFFKDLLSLPRPLSPPLHRITMTGYAALEYGFPSTHSANAVSVVAYLLLHLHSPSADLPDKTKSLIEAGLYFYAFSIVMGRLYCGMHGFLDVIFGSILGVAVGVTEFYYGPALDLYMHTSSWKAPLIAAVIAIALVRVHPEPADDCPCFDDSVACAGVIIGLEIGTWTYGKTRFDPFDAHAHGPQSIDVNDLSLAVRAARVVFGVAVVFAWREVTKPALLKGLPHVFRAIERAGLILPRRFFKSATQYESVSPQLRMDNVFPAVSDIPKAVESFRHAGARGRSVSVGPQSAADAYETLAYRERRRRESGGSNASIKSKASLGELRNGAAVDGDHGASSGAAANASAGGVKKYEMMMGEGDVIVSPEGEDGEVGLYGRTEINGLEEKVVFSRLAKSRARYDVEVVTKLVVYTGMFLLIV
jgi:dihydrosphingosine 1-phosphate phosphatase